MEVDTMESKHDRTPVGWVLALGTPFDGMTLIGPFASAQDAGVYADLRVAYNWEIVAVYDPPDGSEEHREWLRLVDK
jgi:hypothetical protein